ncbi:hypothetical protein QM787_04110 [Rhodococcus ruber]|uniref:Minor tail protein n=2 Tax=Rhodococcus TaxID=1827 RepID=A0ABQ0YJ11_9NOCA|nr:MULTISPECIES: hypothetical protein [Rhodococcus]ETT24887.1 hypothetical protein RR21198_4287 [Rhodococcus rhodochrous ATCC 21198]MCD2127685.1 phage tail family protein [Rhodococcus ruber]MCZ4504342.1 hypothetical protein [Rhodococcus ruber]MCZ4529422.1 hypothetical protein [Rhodococcus ruber]MCZ4621003.1 hypothetical protein [Rhodococcus ruber]
MSALHSRVQVRWASHLGTEWNLMSGTEGAILPKGLKSILLPKFTQLTHKTARRHGVRFEGIDWDAGDCTMTVVVGDTWVSRPAGNFRRGDEFLYLDRSFRDSFSPLYPGTLEVEALGESRSFSGRLVELDDGDVDTMPDVRGTAEYEITLAAESPFWRGKDVVFDFPFTGSATPDNYYGPTNAAPDFYITGGNAIGNAVLTNPGQVEVWPTWTIDGPGQAVVGVGEHITYVSGLAAGERLVIVTDPSHSEVVDGGGNRAWDRIGGLYDFAPVKPGDDVVATAQIIGGGPGANIRLELPTFYLAAY